MVVHSLYILNKADLADERQVTQKEASDLARSFGVPFITTSAKTRLCIDETFHELVREIRKDQKLHNAAMRQKKKRPCTLL